MAARFSRSARCLGRAASMWIAATTRSRLSRGTYSTAYSTRHLDDAESTIDDDCLPGHVARGVGEEPEGRRGGFARFRSPTQTNHVFENSVDVRDGLRPTAEHGCLGRTGAQA